MGVEKRRKKKSRVQNLSSSDDESDNNHSSSSELSELSDNEPEPVIEADDVEMEETPRELIHKMPKNSESDFTQVYLNLVTEQFGDDLASLRQSNDFTSASIAQLVGGLKQGVDIFNKEQQAELSRT